LRCICGYQVPVRTPAAERLLTAKGVAFARRTAVLR
jgi:hypothetical protein